MGPSANIEREVKLDAGVGFRVPDMTGLIPGIRVDERPDARLHAIYVDTEDLRLMRNGLTLRHRQDRRGGAGAERGWTLKLPAPADGKGLVRKELTWPGAWGNVPRTAAALVRAFDRGKPLVPVARLVTQRRRLVLSDATGQALLEVDDDIVSVMDGRSLAARFREVEVEVTGPGGEVFLERVVARLREAGALPGDERPKVVRALGPRAVAPPDVTWVELTPDATVREVVAASLAAGYRRLTEHDPGVRLDEDIEDVHQARVATRRLRSDLRTFGAVVDAAWADPVREELGWLAAALGRVRDADVLGVRLAKRVAALEPDDQPATVQLRKRLDMQRRGAFRDLLAAMDSDRYLRLLDTLAAAAVTPPLVALQPASAPALSGEPAAAIDLPLAVRDPGGDLGAPDAAPRPVPGVAGVDTAGQGAGASGPEPVSVSAGVAGAGGALPAGINGGRWVPFRLTVPASSSVGQPLTTGVTTTHLLGDRSSEGQAAATRADDAPTDAAPTDAAPADAATPGAAGGADEDVPAAGEGPAGGAEGAVGAKPGPLVGAEPGPSAGDEPASEVLPLLLRRPWRKLCRAVDDLGAHPEDEALHEVRIRAKRVRYAAEAVAVVVGPAATRLAKDAAALQEVLGDQHDAVVAEAWLREASRTAKGPTALVAGQLIAEERAAQRQGRKDWEPLATRATRGAHRAALRPRKARP